MRAYKSNGALKWMEVGSINPLGRVHGVNIWPVHFKVGVGLLFMGEGPRIASLRDGGNRVRLASQNSVTFPIVA